MKKKYLAILFLLPFFLFASYQFLIPKPTFLSQEGLVITGKFTNQADIQGAIDVIQQNLQAATNKDLPNYLETLVASAQTETQVEMSIFFNDYNLNHELLSIEVLDQQPNQLLLKASQRTKKIPNLSQKEKYRDHVSDANHTLIKEHQQWKIAETIMTSTHFID